ncbi:DUF2721 domain-containing protein [Pelagicoccus sp. NFK12]|uniref:DUF2721 domain-containing protein n=1 Tax=Pelagicoccus enzymogenes TaxID=2773457 RepID=A0A927FCZ1_9BACT|nr:DUF2721 domain-containing protein [Pelagicoccus enzymogenes]MBD5782119.1 DUF2721 domain-containing protein [Pelagicoccus enzymogenes]MDQ8196872.1 DUF2721 domain-containing protein [Pelagicoccus enzymogenes]
MSDLTQLTLENYQAILAPFLMMTSAATLAWALQTRFSRIVQGIRSLLSDGSRDNIDYASSLEKQISNLTRRSLLLRNAVATLYGSMCLSLLSAILLAFATVANLPLASAVVATFLLSLIALSAGLLFALKETTQHFVTLKEEIGKRP